MTNTGFVATAPCSETTYIDPKVSCPRFGRALIKDDEELREMGGENSTPVATPVARGTWQPTHESHSLSPGDMLVTSPLV